MNYQTITIKKTINAPLELVYNSYINPKDNIRWNTAGDGWTTSYATINAVTGGSYDVGYRSPDGLHNFPLAGNYLEVIPNSKITSIMGDRKVNVDFVSVNSDTEVTITFDAENENSMELQSKGWGNILNNFATHVEKKAKSDYEVIDINTTVDASPKAIWNALLDQNNYKQWTAPFTEGSYYEGRIEFGEIIKFYSPAHGYLKSEVVVCIPEYQISFKHLGFYSQQDVLEGEDWKNNRETYTINQEGNTTTLNIYQEMTKKEYEFFAPMWTKALEILKSIAEKKN